MRHLLSVCGRLQIYNLMNDTVLIGHDLEAACAAGAAVLAYDQHNLIVNNGLSAISRFLGNNINAPTINGGSGFSTLADLTIGTMALGSSVSPAPPVVTDSTSVATLVYSPVLSVSYPTAFSIRFSGVLPIGELIGTTITEEALKTVSGLVFAKVALATPYMKTGANAAQFDHTITFARA